MCGIFGVTHNKQAAYLTYLGLHALQHRGEEACGIVSSDGRRLHREVASGLVSESLGAEKIASLKGQAAVGHVRYSTAGGSLERNAQPLMAHTSPWGEIAIAHNGNIPGYKLLRTRLQRQGAMFHTNSDTEIFLAAIGAAIREAGKGAGKGLDAFARILQQAISPVQGAYSLILLNQEFMAAARDPWGLRPLSMARMGNGWAFSSETNAFNLIGAQFERDIEPGEILIVSRKGPMKSFKSESARIQAAPCVFELVYFSRPDSRVFGRDVYDARRAMGRQLAREAPAKGADLVIAVPDSANVQALGYAQELGLPCEEGLVRSHYIGRTFIAPSQSIRDFGAKLKYNPVRSVLEGKNVVVVDDSIVRGTTSKKIIGLLRDLGGAREIHVRVASPPIVSPCFYGIDMPTRKELIASRYPVDKIKEFLGVESLAYLSLEGMLKAAGASKDQFCHACFSGEYRVAQDTIRRELS